MLTFPVVQIAFPQDISARRGVCARRALAQPWALLFNCRKPGPVLVAHRGPGARIHRDRHAGPAHAGFQETGRLANPAGDFSRSRFSAPQGFRYHRLSPRGRLRRRGHLCRVVGGYYRLGCVYRRASAVLYSRELSGRRAARQGRRKTRDHRRPAELESLSDRGRRRCVLRNWGSACPSSPIATTPWEAARPIPRKRA